MKTCPQCGTENKSQAERCSECDAPLPASTHPLVAGATQPTPVTRPSEKPSEAVAQEADTTLVLPEGEAPAANDEPATLIMERKPGFVALPDGALIGSNGREYVILSTLQEDDDVHTYLGRSQRGYAACGSCGFGYNLAGEESCLACGAILNSEDAEPVDVVVKESKRLSAFAAEVQLAESRLADPRLRLPLAAFRQRIAGQERQYVVLPPAPARWLQELSPPQPPVQVLEWGIKLAQGLATLHDQQVAFGAPTGARIGLENGDVCLADFGQAYYPGRDGLYRQDVSYLALLLYYLMTGEREFQPQADLPEPVQNLFLRVLAEQNGFRSPAAFSHALDETLRAIRLPESLRFRVGRRTNVGQVRRLNEDSFFTFEMVLSNQSLSLPLGVFAIADGMGGHTAGEVASGLALRALARNALQELVTPEPGVDMSLVHSRWVERALAGANAEVHEHMRTTGTDMGTTLVLALLVGNDLFLGNVGDSRAYLITSEAIQQLTVDHSLVERLVATGQLTREEARTHPQRNVIYRTIGDRPEVEMDTWQLQLEPGQKLLLCSDGLSGMLHDELIHQMVIEAAAPQDAVDQLVHAANRAGGHDNITALIVELFPEE